MSGQHLVDMQELESELRQLVQSVNDSSLFEQPVFAAVPPEQRLLKDIAFSGDGEPTLAPQFLESVKLAAEVRKSLCADSVKIVLITNASTLHVPSIRSALDVLLQHNGEIWAKLDAGTPDFYNTIAMASIPFQKICSNLAEFTKDCPAVIQTCFLSLYGQGPGDEEVRHYAERLNEFGKISYVQIYTVARHTPVSWATPLENQKLDSIAERVRELTHLDVRTFYSR